MTENERDESLEGSLTRVSQAIRSACSKQIGVLDSSFLCQSLSALGPRDPECVAVSATLRQVVERLKSKSIGCVLVVGEDGRLKGIFSERDLLLKVVGNEAALYEERIERFMTPDPVAELPTTTVAFALTLMSSGGFRHLPLVDQDGMPIGIISVKDIVEFIVGTLMRDIEGL